MPDIRIVSSIPNPGARANARGHLFEKLMAHVLRRYGYEIDSLPHVNYAGMEIDIEGHDLLNKTPLYAECKCYDTQIDSPSLQAFYGKYMAKWRKDSRSRGLFIAIPGLNSHAKGFYNENCDGATDITVSLLEKGRIINAILDADLAIGTEGLSLLVPADVGTAGDQVLLYSDHGILWVQYIISPGAAIPDKYALFTAKGDPVVDTQTIEHVLAAYPDLSGFKLTPLPDNGLRRQPADVKASHADEADQIVEVRGSSAWFEYQFPASPQFFVGRADVLADFRGFVASILAAQTSARGVLFTGNSGWGKSSTVLTTASLLREMGHFAIVIDCRSISSVKSVLRVVDVALQKLHSEQGELFEATGAPITGFDGAIQALQNASEELRRSQRLAFIFLDQFENLFFLPDALRRIRDMLLAMCDYQASVVFGFAWKTDLVGATNDFPFQLRDSIADSCKRFSVETFSEIEVSALLDKLRAELRTEIRKDLRFFLSEFSQGFPWLLKKLCAHVKGQREAGVPQAEIANRLLNVEELFKEDLGGITSDQEDALRRIAKAAPVEISELSEHYSPHVVQSLVDSRLVVRIGNKYDIYWDIFRDYLNSGRIPVQENYLLRIQVRALLKAVSILRQGNGRLQFKAFREQTRLSEHSAMNVVRDLRLLGLATVDSGIITFTIADEEGAVAADEQPLPPALRTHIKERLGHNRLVSGIISVLKSEETRHLNDIAQLLSQWCPYVTATADTWRMYARVFATWMDLTDLATFDVRKSTLSYYEASTELRQRDLRFSSMRPSSVRVPDIQYSPVDTVARMILEGLEGKRVPWHSLKKSTVRKAFATLEELRFVIRTGTGYRVGAMMPSLEATVATRKAAFAAAVSRLPAFSQFLELLDKYTHTGRSHLLLGREFRERLKIGWRDGTAQTNAKIMLDWARHTGLAPGVFAEGRRRKSSSMAGPPLRPA